ncbi:hypothetical protein [Sulfitobacter sp. M22]|uniref:hypothetical protein n=1 Tax=Sulfitobacter sp. M22 TaxID=2675332 RepID=UPI001F393FCB|nr:hypothetical protein [Sulfitobacter sp. M22]MCF7727117.1 hypothetical protein [Sulfitobacter sp. M22]
MTEKILGRGSGKVARQTMKAYINQHRDRGKLLPNRGAALWLAEILRETGLNRNQLSTNHGLRQMLEDYAQKSNLAYSSKGQVAPEEETLKETVNTGSMVPVERLREAQRRLGAAQRRSAELMAENVRLRSQLSRGDEVAKLIEIGGRIKPGDLDL